MPVERSQEPRDCERSFVATLPFDFQALVETWQREFIFFRVNRTGAIEFVAASIRDLLGYEPEELLGRDYRQIFDLEHPQQAELAEFSEQSLTSDPQKARRSVARRKDGEWAFLAMRERELRGPNGVDGKEFMAQDVTARVQAELALRQSERKYRRLVEGVKYDYVLYSRNAEGLITYVSPSVEQVLGYVADDLIGRPAGEFYVRKDQPLPPSKLALGHRDVEPSDVKFIADVRHRDGSFRIMETQERPLHDSAGRLIAIEGIAKDVTQAAESARQVRQLNDELERRVILRTEELSRINEDLRVSHARYRDVVETQNEFIVRWRPDGTRTFVNEAYCRFRNATQEQLLGEPFLPLIHPEDRSYMEEGIARICPEQPSHYFEGRVQRSDGAYAWMQWENHGFFDDRGRPIEYQSVGRDVTELKAAGDLLRQKEAHLAHLSRLATMGEMVAGIAHEISQPLHAAKTFAEAARRNLQNGGEGRIHRAIDCMNEISQAVTRTVQIIRRLREFTKAQPFQLEKLQLNQLVHEAMELVSHEIRRLNVKVRLELCNSLPLIAGDRIQIEQLFVNLLKNACEAMEQTPIEERVLTIGTKSGGGAVCLSICDSGVGISEAQQQRLFEPFFTTKPEGMGMGLVLSKSIADAHAMNLRFQNNEGSSGITVNVEIPTENR